MDFVFAFKKVVSRLLFPIPIIVYLFVAGVLLLWFGKTERKQRWGKICVLASFTLLLLFSTGPFSGWMLASLEHRYTPFRAEDQEAGWKPEFVVVLGGDHDWNPTIPAESRVGHRTAARLSEGVRLKQQIYPESTLVVTGGKVSKNQKMSIAEDMAALAKLWGVSEAQIFVEDQSKDTKDHVAYLRDKLAGRDFAIVTSASHMPRAMALFEKAGLKPVAAPVTFYTGTPFLAEAKPDGRLSWKSFLPKQSNLQKAERAFYEYMGLAWAKLRGQI